MTVNKIKGNYKNDVLTGTTGNDAIYGYGGNDFLQGSAGNDTLDGGRGIDTLVGGDGNDTYIVDNTADVITELSGGGTDTVITPFNWTLGDNLEKLVLINSAVNGAGNTLNNTIIGNALGNNLYGDAGNDTLDASSGMDTLTGGTGNDVLKIQDFNGDLIDGGAGNDTLQITGEQQFIDLRSATNITGIETVKFDADANNAIQIDAQSVLNHSQKGLKIDATGENTLIMDSGWTDNGLSKGYEAFTKGGATLLVNDGIGNIEVVSNYTISDASSASAVKSVFSSASDTINIDFGGKTYDSTGVTSIDLTGFGLNDKLVIAQHDGLLAQGTAHYHLDQSNRYKYIHEFTYKSNGTISDLVSWKSGATTAKIISLSAKYVNSLVNGTHQVSAHVNAKAGLVSSSTFITPTFTTPPYTSPTGHWTLVKHTIQLTGLPSGLPDSQFVFV